MRAAYTTTFAGIAINHVPAFIVAEMIGAVIGLIVGETLFRASPKETE